MQLIPEVVLSSPVRNKSPKLNPYSIAYVVKGFPNVVVKGKLVVAILFPGEELIIVNGKVDDIIKKVESRLDESENVPLVVTFVFGSILVDCVNDKASVVECSAPVVDGVLIVVVV